MDFPVFRTIERISERKELLRYLINKKVKDIIKVYLSNPESDMYIDIQKNTIIERASLSVVMILENLSQIGFTDDESTGSVGALSIKSPDGSYDYESIRYVNDKFYAPDAYNHLSLISISDKKYSTIAYANLIGQKIIEISIIQGKYLHESIDKIGVVLKFEKGKELIIYLGGKLYFKENLPQEVLSEIKSIEKLTF